MKNSYLDHKNRMLTLNNFMLFMLISFNIHSVYIQNNYQKWFITIKINSTFQLIYDIKQTYKFLKKLRERLIELCLISSKQAVE